MLTILVNTTGIANTNNNTLAKCIVDTNTSTAFEKGHAKKLPEASRGVQLLT